MLVEIPLGKAGEMAHLMLFQRTRVQFLAPMSGTMTTLNYIVPGDPSLQSLRAPTQMWHTHTYTKIQISFFLKKYCW